MQSISAPPNRLNDDPPILWGATRPELTVLVAASALLWLFPVLGLLIKLGIVVLIVGVLPLMSALTVRVLARLLERRRRGRPRSQYHQELALWMQSHGFGKPGIVTRSGWWTTSRTP